MEPNAKPTAPVIWLSVIHVIYLMSLPVLTNFTIAPIVYHDTVSAVCWAIFGLLGMPLAFAGMMSLNPLPGDISGAMMRTLFLPLSAGLWWWYQGGTLLEFFAIMLVYEFLAIYLSIFLMSFIPLRYYDPKNPNVGNSRTYYNILIFQGMIAAGGFATILIIAILPWAKNISFWYHPFTYVFLLIAAIEYLISNVKLQKRQSHRWENNQQRPAFFEADTVTIEGFLLLSPIPWLISIWFINSGL